MSLADELRQLQELHERGVLSDEEYAQAKARVIGGSATPKEAPPPPAPPPRRREPERREREPDRGPPPRGSGGNTLVVVVVIGLLVAMFAGLFISINMVPGFFGKRGAGGGLTLKVDRVETGDGRFLVHMTATNNTKDALRLPLFGYFFVTDDLGNQYKADPFSSTFPQDVAPGATVSGYALMEKPLAPGATKLKVAFTTVFGSFAVKSVSVENVPVR
jgi:hypothetical protein